MKRLWNWIKRLLIKRRRVVAAGGAYTLKSGANLGRRVRSIMNHETRELSVNDSVLTRREAANYEGMPFQQPNGKLPPDFFWKQDEGAIGFAHWLDRAKPRAWRIYRKPVERVER